MAGIIDDFTDAHQILPQDDPQAVVFAREMQKILDHLQDKNPDLMKGKPPYEFDFRLSAETSIRGFTSPEAHPPIIAFSKGMIEFLHANETAEGRESWLAAILVHEIARIELQKSSKSGKKGGTLERTLADGMSMDILAHADYPPTAMEEFLTALLKRNENENKLLGNTADKLSNFAIMSVDRHGQIGARIAALKAQLIGLQGSDAVSGIKVGHTYSTPYLNAELVDAARGAEFGSPVKAYMDATAFDKANASEKLRIYRKAQTDLLLDGESKSESRHKEMDGYAKRVIAAVAPQWRQQSAGSPLAKDIEAWIYELNAGGFADNLWRDKSSAWKQLSTNIYQEMLRTLAQENGTLWQATDPITRAVSAYQSFVNVTDENRIREAAERLVPELKAQGMERRKPILLGKASIPKFAMPSLQEMQALRTPRALPWEGHIQAALRHDDENVAFALQSLGVADQDRLKSLSSLSGYNAVAEHPLTYNSKGELESNSYVRSDDKQILLDDEYRMTGLLDHSRKNETEASYNRERIKKERAALENIDWSSLERGDASTFAQRYKDFLKPMMGEQPTEHPFARAVVDKLEQLIRDDPQNHRKTANALLKEINLSMAHTDLSLAGIKLKPQFSNINKIAPDHPMMRFALESDLETIGVGTKKKWLEYASMFDATYEGNGKDVETHWRLKNYASYLPPMPDTPAEMARWMQNTLGETAYEGISYMQHDSLRKFLSEYKKPLTVQETQQLLNEISAGSTQGWYAKTSALVVEKAKETLDGLPKPNTPLDTLISEYKQLAAERVSTSAVHSIFSLEPSLLQRYDDALRKALEAMPDPVARYDVIEGLMSPAKFTLREPGGQTSHYSSQKLLSDPIAFSGRIPSPSLRGWMTDQLALGFAQRLGKDDRSNAYAQRLQSQIEHVETTLAPAVAADMLTRVSHARLDDKQETGNLMQLQRANAKALAKTILDIRRNDLSDYELSAAIGEGVVSLIDKESGTRDIALEFLTKPYSEDLARNTLEKLEKKVTGNDSKKYLLTDQSVPLQVKMVQMEQMHRNFWNASFQTRSLAARAILFGSSEVLDTPEARDAVDYQLRKVLDTTFPDKRDRNNRYARLIIEKYIANTDDIEARRLMVGALLTAGDPNERGTQLDTGRALKLVLDALGPAGRKLAQSIESAPETPEDIRKAFGDSKTMAVQLRRDEIFALVDKEGPQQGQEADALIGKVLGAGSYGITVEFQRKPEDEASALTMLYANVGARAKRDLKVLSKTADDVAAVEKVFEPVKDMVRQAEQMSAVEVDMELAAKQAEVASKLYDGVKVSISGREYDFFSAPFLSYGKNYKEFKIIPGQHFNDMAHDTPETEQRRRDCAKAILTVELAHMFSGRPFDHDRHGGQQRIEGNRIGQFDFGALRTEALSPREKQMIGHVIGGVLRGHFAEHKPLKEVIRYEIDKCAQNGTEKDFICAMERGALALGNFTKVLSEEEIKQVIGTVFVSKQMSPDIIHAVKERLETGVAGGAIYSRVTKELEAAAAKSTIKLTMPQHEFDSSKDTSELQKAPDDSKLTMKHDKKALVTEGGAGFLGTIVGFGWLYAVCKRINEKKKKGEEITWRDRVEQGAAGVVSLASTAVVVDALTGARGMTKIGQYTKLIMEQNKSGPREL